MTVPPDHYFVLGDNRGNSSDSRVFGSVPAENYVGLARVVWWSTADGAPRWDRLGVRL